MSLTLMKKWSEPSGAPAGPDLGLKFSGNEDWNAKRMSWLAQCPSLLLPKMSTLCNANVIRAAPRNLIAVRMRFLIRGTQG
jgi:hypothetical protein